MCLIAFAFDAHPHYQLVLASNRDEFYHRPADAAHWWADSPALLGGRDRQAQGTWLAVHRRGRIAALTNVRENPRQPRTGPSRGDLPRAYLLGSDSPLGHARTLAAEAAAAPQTYAGFNLLMFAVGAQGINGSWVSNRDDAPQALQPGVYGLSNHLFDTPWPKVLALKQALREATRSASSPTLEQLLFDALADERAADDDTLPATGVPIERERLLSAAFVRSPDYGTRTSTLLLADRTGHVTFIERNWLIADPRPGAYLERRFEFDWLSDNARPGHPAAGA